MVRFRVLRAVAFAVFFNITCPIAFALNGDRPCLIPFIDMINPLTRKPFRPHDAINHLRLGDQYTGRYLVADINTTFVDGKGYLHCRGVNEVLPDPSQIDELRDPDTKANFDLRVGNFAQGRYNKGSTDDFQGAKHCNGQHMHICEMRGNQARLIATFITATRKPHRNHGKSGLDDRYYAPINKITQRWWTRNRPYDPATDGAHDNRMGGSMGNKDQPYDPEGKNIEMPNFLRYHSLWGLSDGYQNGIHESSAAEGRSNKFYMGAPISLGCFRLRDYASKFARWYIPTGAKFFIHYINKLYWRYPPPKGTRYDQLPDNWDAKGRPIYKSR